MPSSGERDAEIEERAEDVLACAGLELDDWQWSFLVESLRTTYDGKWSAFNVAGVVPRQSGKGAIMEARQLVGLYVLAEQLQIHTAHEFKTCAEHFFRVKGLIENAPDLLKQVKIIRTGAGDQGIELKSGERLRFVARSRSAIRGFSINTVYFDEAFELDEQTLGNVIPALSSKHKRQVWYFSSAPHYGSDVLHALLHRAEQGEDELFLRAWESEPDTRPDDVEAWRRVNPAIDIRIDEDFVKNEMRTLCATHAGVAEFKRERLGIREGGDGEAGVVPYDKWERLTIAAPPASRITSVAFGLAVSEDGTWAAVASAGRLPDRSLYIDSVQYRQGTDWVESYVRDLMTRKNLPIRIDPLDPAGSFIRPLRDGFVDEDGERQKVVEVVEVNGREYAQACGELLTSITDGRVHHIGQEPLDRSVRAASRRAVGREGSWVWLRSSVVDISPLKAATLALSGVARGDDFFMY